MRPSSPVRFSFCSLSLCSLSIAVTAIATAGCGEDRGDPRASPDAAITPPDSPESADITEKKLDVTLSLVQVPSTADPTILLPGLRITTHDGLTPVLTDVWLYTLTNGQMQELTGFTPPAPARRNGHLLMPATIGGAPSGLVPADDGRANGVTTDGPRRTMQQGALVPGIDGTVVVTLPAPPTDPIVVVAGIEDERYAGAAAILPNDTPGVVPDGVGVPETHRRVSYQRDVAPILEMACQAACHHDGGPAGAGNYPLNTRDMVVNNNFAMPGRLADCKTKNPDDPTAEARCVRDITAAEFMVEPGAPALSGFLTRSRPDEDRGMSANGLGWFGGGMPRTRYNATYGDRRMPSTTTSNVTTDWTNEPTYFDKHPEDFQVLFDWVAQGALP